MTKCSDGCQCDGPGFCPVYNIKMNAPLYERCKSSSMWRDNFRNFFQVVVEQDEESIAARKQRALDVAAQEQNAKQLDEVVKKVEEAGVTVDNYTEKQEGLGDLLGNVFSRLGITEEAVEKWAGIGGCGCDKRKKFLNKILPFRKSEPSIAPQKKES